MQIDAKKMQFKEIGIQHGRKPLSHGTGASPTPSRMIAFRSPSHASFFIG
jgi:hypothetical protein